MHLFFDILHNLFFSKETLMARTVRIDIHHFEEHGKFIFPATASGWYQSLHHLGNDLKSDIHIVTNSTNDTSAWLEEVRHSCARGDGPDVIITGMYAETPRFFSDEETVLGTRVGLAIIEKIRRISDIPVIVLTEANDRFLFSALDAAPNVAWKKTSDCSPQELIDLVKSLLQLESPTKIDKR
jgi:hypothetical protein